MFIRFKFFSHILVFSFGLLHVAMKCYQMEIKTLWQANSEWDERFTLHLEKDSILDQYLLNKKINYGKDIL